MPLLWLDTNAARSAEDLRKIAGAARDSSVSVVIHTQVYLERRRQQQARLGARFDSGVFDQLLERLQFEVVEMVLTRAVASRWADTLARRFPADREWELAKKATLGGELLKGFEVPPGSMPMTTDWLVALEIEHDPDSYVFTKDTGKEWETLREAEPQRVFTSLPDVLQWIGTQSSSHATV